MAPPSQPKGPHDVFLSFRGPDTRIGIASLLYDALTERGIYTFKDDEESQKGEKITEVLIKTIKKSHIAVILFSPTFASSPWCLDEVAKIMERQAAKKIIVLPVFFNVDPREVREGRYKNKEFFKEHEEKYGSGSDRVKGWKKTLTEAGNLIGWEFNDWTVAEPPKESITESPKESTRIQLQSGESKVTVELKEGTPIQLGSRKMKDQALLVKSIVREILIKLDPHFQVTEFSVGLDSRVDELISKYKLKSKEETCTIGFCSMGGMGKTTLAKALYKSIFIDFEGFAYVDGIKGTKRETDKMVRLQEKLLSQLLMTKEISLNSDSEGSGLIAKRLGCKRVLLILDGVDDICQIYSLAQRSWFGKGSKIIVTTTDEGLLEMIGASIHTVMPLEKAEACELFSSHASGNTKDEIGEKIGNYVDKVVLCTNCHPLALKVLGCAFARSEENEWDDILAKFDRSSDPGVDNVLSVTYEDGLDPEEKQIFLHIACFFNGWSRRYVEGVLKIWDPSVHTRVSNLIRRSLIMDKNGTLIVHDLIELMGKNIVDRECIDDAAKRSRLWRQRDVVNVLSGDEETDAVKAIVLALPSPETIAIRSEAFAKLKKLRFLIMINVKTKFPDPICLPRALRWFEWPECPASSLKLTSPDNLAVFAVRKCLFKEPREP